MSIHHQVLGQAGRDNALLVRIESGQALHRLLFDCGDGCLSNLPLSEIQAIDQLLFSHLHMDHVGGFDGFFRATHNRNHKPMLVWGPPKTIEIIRSRFRGFLWNSYEHLHSTWYVHDIYHGCINSHLYEAGEAFSIPHPLDKRVFEGPIIDTQDYTIEALRLNHGTPSLGYIVREKPRLSLDESKLGRLKLRAGPWVQQLKQWQPGQPSKIEIAGKQYDLARLREQLLVEKPGDSLAYLTDFLLDDQALARLQPALRGCGTLICESQYREQDRELAQRNYHLTARQSAELARQAHVQALVLFHISERYKDDERLELLREARAIFPSASFPPHWKLDLP